LKEPLLWFLIVGCLLFAADQFLSDQPDRVVADNSVRSHLDSLWQAQTGKAATTEELDSLLENWVREEVLYKEALRLGLDRNDSIVRRRLVQKIGFLIEEVEEESSEWEGLENYYQQNIENYSMPVRYSFSQIFFKQPGRAEEFQKALADGANWRDLGEPTMLNDSFVSRGKREIISSFGPDFANEVVQLDAGSWVGPITSSFGYHLVRIERIFNKEITPLAYIEKKVLSDYRQSKMDAAMESYYQELREKYQVVYE